MEPREEPRRRSFVGFLALMAVMLVARGSFADHYRVPSGSMMPTVEVGDRVVVNKAAYGLRVPLTQAWLGTPRMPARGDVVVLSSPEDGTVLLKRVVAVAGDRVEVRGGEIRIDGRPIPIHRGGAGEQEDLGAPHPVRLGAGGPDFGPTAVPLGKVLVMGDNRGESHDGRSFGFVAVEALLGRAVGVYLRDGGVCWLPL